MEVHEYAKLLLKAKAEDFETLKFDEMANTIDGDNFGKYSSSGKCLLSGKYLSEPFIEELLCFISIYPSNIKPYFHVNIIKGEQICTRRPMTMSGVKAMLEYENIPIASTIWKIETYKINNNDNNDNNRNTYIYFIQSNIGGPIKIGLSDNPDLRLEEIQRMSPFKLQILATTIGDYKLENELHKRFKHLRYHDEWFEPGKELLNYISEARHENR